MAENPRRFTVGYALAPKKQKSFIQPSLVDLSRKRGVDLVPIDTTRPLAEQGPFDCVLHKLHGEDWKAQLDGFATKNPGVPIVDPPSPSRASTTASRCSRDVKVGTHYLVIDINYFPGFAKMPSYEGVLTDFFWNIVHEKEVKRGRRLRHRQRRQRS
ncbi:unnamed protein product, partial [Musa banksii]